MSDDRGIGYREGNTSIYRASGIGYCLTRIVAYMLDYKEAPSAYQQGILDDAAREGNLHEDSIIDRLVEDGYRIDETQTEIELQVLPRVLIRGHTDGIVYPPRAKKPRVLEVKTMSKDRFKKWERSGEDTAARMASGEWTGYAWQISAYMHTLNLPAIYVVKNRDSGKLLIDELKIPPVSMADIQKKVITAEKYRKRDELPVCDAPSGDKFFCPFPFLHEDTSDFGSEPDNEPEPIDDAQRALIGALADQYDDLASQVGLMKPMDEERKAVGQRLIAAMGKSEYAYVGPWKVKNVGNKGRANPDKAALAKALGIDIDELEQTYWTVRYPYNYPKLTKRETE